MTTRARLFLVFVLLVELGVGGALIYSKRSELVPPGVPAADPITDAEFRRLAAGCQTGPGWGKLGEAYLVTGHFSEAEACLARAEALAPTAETAFRHAFALERLGRLIEANAQYNTAIERGHPRMADCRYYLGKNALRQEDPRLAVLMFSGPWSGPGAQYERAVLAQNGAADTAPGEADTGAARLATEWPRAAEPVALQYRAAVARGDRPRAAVLADEFARRPAGLPTPFDTETNWIFAGADGFGRAGVFRDAGREVQAGQLRRAEDMLREVLRARWEPEVADRLADVLFSLGRTEEADRVLTERLERGGPTWDALWILGQTQDARGQSDAAGAAWLRASRLATGPGPRGMWADLADRYERQNERARHFRAKAHLLDAMAAVAGARYDEAVKAATAATDADPALAHGWFVAGEAHRLAGREADARGAYDRCLALDPNHGRADRARKLLSDPGKK